VNISYDVAPGDQGGGVDGTKIAEIEIDNEHGHSKQSWPLSWVEVGEIKDFLPEAGSAIKYGKSQVPHSCRLALLPVAQRVFCLVYGALVHVR
jgi:hypothetical protein